MLESRFTMLFNFIGYLICMTAPGLSVFSNPAAQFSNPSYFLVPAFQNSDSWSRSQPPAVQAGQMQYFTPFALASFAAAAS